MLEYSGKFIHSASNDNYSILLNKEHLDMLQLLLIFAVDPEKLKYAKRTQVFHRELREELEDILCSKR